MWRCVMTLEELKQLIAADEGEAVEMNDID